MVKAECVPECAAYVDDWIRKSPEYHHAYEAEKAASDAVSERGQVPFHRDPVHYVKWQAAEREALSKAADSARKDVLETIRRLRREFYEAHGEPAPTDAPHHLGQPIREDASRRR